MYNTIYTHKISTQIHLVFFTITFQISHNDWFSVWQMISTKINKTLIILNPQTETLKIYFPEKNVHKYTSSIVFCPAHKLCKNCKDGGESPRSFPRVEYTKFKARWCKSVAMVAPYHNNWLKGSLLFFVSGFMSSTFGNESWSPEEKEGHGYCNALGTGQRFCFLGRSKCRSRWHKSDTDSCPDLESGITQVQPTIVSTSTNAFHSRSSFEHHQYLFLKPVSLLLRSVT